MKKTMLKIACIAMTSIPVLTTLTTAGEAKTAAQTEVVNFKKYAKNEKILYGNGTKLSDTYKVASKKLGKPLSKGKTVKEDFYYVNRYTYKNNITIEYVRFDKKDKLADAMIGVVEGQFKQKITYKDLKAGLPDLFASKTTLFYSAHYSQLGYDLFPAQKLTTKSPLKSSTVIKSYRFIGFY